MDCIIGHNFSYIISCKLIQLKNVDFKNEIKYKCPYYAFSIIAFHAVCKITVCKCKRSTSLTSCYIPL